MADRERPDPEVLLRRVQAEEAGRTRARLKVFLGYAPGVGKTYTMLESARRLKAAGVDIVVGTADTHGRAETAALLEGLEVLPRRAVDYRGARLAEFDLDAALARKPWVVLVDELAHTNAPGSRHAKRWQDVRELLDAGIEVHTTLNVQHVESLNDIVAQITFVRVRETVPDAILDRADEIELVDLPPDELLVRLVEGKVYVPEEAGRAANSFFRLGNLLALREIAMRRAAERVDAAVRAYREAHAIEKTWPAGERILVCVGSSPSSAQLIRGARRMADGLGAPWVAACADAPDAYPMTPADRERLEAHLRLADSLGAEVVRLTGSRVSEELLRYARRTNVTRIVLGKPRHRRLRDVFRGSLVEEIVRGSGEIEVHFVSGDPRSPSPPNRRDRVPAGFQWIGHALSVLLVAMATTLGVAGRGILAPPDVVMVYLLAIMMSAFRFGRGPALVAAGCAVAAYDFFFVPPFFTFSVESSKHFLTFVMMFGVGLAFSGLTARIRRQERAAMQSEQRTAALYSLTRELVLVLDEEQAGRIVARHAAEVFAGDAAVLLRSPSGGLTLAGVSGWNFALGDQDLAVARWSADHGQPAGLGTDTLPGTRVTCVPLVSRTATLGVLTLHRAASGVFDMQTRTFLDAFARQAAIAIERARLSREAESAAVRAKAEEMRNALLSAVSHDLRTPLASITGAGTALRDDGDRLTKEQRGELLDAICTESERMEKLVSDLLDMTRLESGGLSLRREWVPLEEIVGSAMARLDEKLLGRDVKVTLPGDLPLVFVDPVLFEQLFVNLLDNAVKYTPAGSPIEVGARREEDALVIEVADRGPGLPEGCEARVFEKFWRGPHPGVGGVGLGLPICRGIVEAHGGTISAETRDEGGASFAIRMPALEAPAVAGEEAPQ